MAADYLYEERFISQQAVYPRNENWFIAGIFGFGNFSENCLEKEEVVSGKDEMTLGGWIFLLGSWGIILLLTVICFIKVFSRKEIK